MNKEYYLVEGDEKSGPYTFYELTQLDIDTYTEIIVGNSDTPKYASELPEFNEYFEQQGIYFPTEDNLASFGKRVAAFLVDYLGLYIIISNILIRMGNVVLPADYKPGDPIPPGMLQLSMVMMVTFLLYKTIFEATGLKGTLGKRIFKLAVVDIDGQRLSVPRSLLRNVGVVLSLTIWLPFLSVLFSEHRQAWYDSWAKTYVIVTQ
jgi:uncharacterized RDD family membrane protein YckC